VSGDREGSRSDRLGVAWHVGERLERLRHLYPANLAYVRLLGKVRWTNATLNDCKFGTTHDALATFARFELPARGLLELVDRRFWCFGMTHSLEIKHYSRSSTPLTAPTAAIPILADGHVEFFLEVTSTRSTAFMMRELQGSMAHGWAGAGLRSAPRS
jgi:hypothetical protein